MVWGSTCEKRGELGCQVAIGPGQLLFSSPFVVRYIPGWLLPDETGARLAFALPRMRTTTVTWTTYLLALLAALARVRQHGKMV